MQAPSDSTVLELLVTVRFSQFSMFVCLVQVSSVGFTARNWGRVDVVARMQAMASKIDLVTRETLAVMAKLFLYLPTMHGAHRPETRK